MITPAEQAFIVDHLNPAGNPLSDVVCEPLANLIESMFRKMVAEEHTIRAYRFATGLFLQYLDTLHATELPADIADKWCPFATRTLIDRRVCWSIRPPAAVLRWVKTTTLTGFVAWCVERGDSPNTIGVRMAAVRKLLHAAIDMGVIGLQQGRQIEQSPVPSNRDVVEQAQPVTTASRQWLSSQQVRLLRGIVDCSTNKGKRDLALLDTILYLALRPDQLRCLRWGNFDTASDVWLFVESPDSEAQRLWPVHSMLKLSLVAWFRSVSFWQDPMKTPLFLNVYKNDVVGRRIISTAAIDLIIDQCAALAHIILPEGRERLTTGVLRRTCARCAYDNGASLSHIQALLGHSSLQLTADFIGVVCDDENTVVDYIHYY